MKNKKHGFTLIELLIVVAIIAILAAAIIIAVAPGTRIDQAEDATKEAHQQVIGTAVHIKVLDVGYANVDALIADDEEDCHHESDPVDVDTDCAAFLGLPSAPIVPGTSDGEYTIAGDGDRVIVNCTGCDPLTF